MGSTSTSSSIRLNTSASTDVGQVRELNEDFAWATTFVSNAPNPWDIAGLLLIADGMGGHAGGELASGLAGETTRTLFCSPDVHIAPEHKQGRAMLGRLSEAIQHINRVVWQQGEEMGGGQTRPGTTLTLALLRSNEWSIGHVGDSRAYLVRPSGIEQITEDDSLVAEAVRRGQMTPEEARDSPFRNQITKAVGLQSEVTPSTYYGHWEAGDVLLLCSDGLSEYVSEADLQSLFSRDGDLTRTCEALIAMANQRGGHDNISIAAARWEEPTLAMSAPLNGKHKPVTWPPVNERFAAPVATNFPIESLEPRALPRRGILMAVVVGATIALMVLAFFGWSWNLARKQHAPQKVTIVPAPLEPITPSPTSTKVPTDLSGRHSRAHASVERTQSPQSGPDNSALKPPSLHISFSEGQQGLVITAIGFSVEARSLRNHVEAQSASKTLVSLKNAAVTQAALRSGIAQLQCLDSSAKQLLADADPKPALVFLPHAKAGQYLLRYAAKGQAPLDLAQFELRPLSSDQNRSH